jgi:hypothetical protein
VVVGPATTVGDRGGGVGVSAGNDPPGVFDTVDSFDPHAARISAAARIATCLETAATERHRTGLAAKTSVGRAAGMTPANP